MIVKKINTREDQRYHDQMAKILDAHKAGKLGKEWYQLNPKNGKMEIRPKNVFKRL